MLFAQIPAISDIGFVKGRQFSFRVVFPYDITDIEFTAKILTDKFAVVEDFETTKDVLAKMVTGVLTPAQALNVVTDMLWYFEQTEAGVKTPLINGKVKIKQVTELP